MKTEIFDDLETILKEYQENSTAPFSEIAFPPKKSSFVAVLLKIEIYDK